MLKLKNDYPAKRGLAGIGVFEAGEEKEIDPSREAEFKGLEDVGWKLIGPKQKKSSSPFSTKGDDKKEEDN